jgi:hypothetical protein
MKMSNEMKLLASIGLLPVLADFLEDLNDQNLFAREMKISTTNLCSQIRRIDERVMKGVSKEVSEEQINMQIAFRQWLTKAEEL